MGSGPAAGADYDPLAVGDRWMYVDETGATSTVSVTGTQATSGGSALVLQTIDNTGTSNELYLRSSSGVSIVPGSDADPITAAVGSIQILRLPVVAGDHWVAIDKTLTAVEDFDGDGRADNLVVHAEITVLGFEPLVTATGNLTQVAHVQTVLTQTAVLTGGGPSITVTSTVDDWYAPGIGLVRETASTTGAGPATNTQTSITAYGLGSLRSESVAPTLVQNAPTAGSVIGGCCVSLTAVFSETMDVSGDNGAVWQLTGPDG